MGDISLNFSLSELTASQAATRSGREIIPTSEEITALTRLVQAALQPIRELLGMPVIITSGLRPEWLNTLIGGSATSQHMQAQAADFVVPGLEPKVVCQRIIASDTVKYDQLILEFDRWIHLSYVDTGELRAEQLTAHTMDGKTVYIDGINA